MRSEDGESFLSCFHIIDAYSDRHFSGEESFDTGPMAPSSEPSVLSKAAASEPERAGTKL